MASNLLGIKVSPKQTVYLKMEEDNGINRGGYYCQLFADKVESEDMRIDHFTIRRERLSGDATSRANQARKICVDKAKEIFSNKRR